MPAAPLRVRVPATSANLGPGFDCLGLALDLHLEVRARPADRDRFAYRGEGRVPDRPDGLVHAGFRAVFAHLDLPAPTVAFEAQNPIPLARGLGSSSAALVAGAALADAWTGGTLGRDGVFALAAELEGHPDNVAPAVYGGFTVSAPRPEGGYTTSVLAVPPGWRLLFGVPGFELPTAKARAALPEAMHRDDAVRTAARAALWALAVARDEPALLRTASIDVLHEPYREPLVPGLRAAREALRAAGAYAAFLSGAGPTIGVVTPEAAEAACREVLTDFVGRGGRVLALRVGAGYELAGTPPVTPRAVPAAP
ncbi:MAG: homoserine kinase [Trueperaceae bacterium]|nr:homoserine kinase [Trueperaceae bacterium]